MGYIKIHVYDVSDRVGIGINILWKIGYPKHPIANAKVTVGAIGGSPSVSQTFYTDINGDVGGSFKVEDINEVPVGVGGVYVDDSCDAFWVRANGYLPYDEQHLRSENYAFLTPKSIVPQQPVVPPIYTGEYVTPEPVPTPPITVPITPPVIAQPPIGATVYTGEYVSPTETTTPAETPLPPMPVPNVPLMITILVLTAILMFVYWWWKR